MRQRWEAQAACLNATTRESDWWCPDEDLPEAERGFQFHLARRVCSTCPVRLDCALAALETLPRTGEHTMRGGLTPGDLVEVARSLGLRWRLTASCGTRSRYVAGCRCDDCRRAHATYEHERRLHARPSAKAQERPSRPRTARERVQRALGDHPATARALGRRLGLKTHVVRGLLAELENAGRAAKVGSHDGAPTFVRTGAAAVRSCDAA